MNVERMTSINSLYKLLKYVLPHDILLTLALRKGPDDYHIGRADRRGKVMWA